MKRVFSLLLAIVCVLSCAGCGDESDGGQGKPFLSAELENYVIVYQESNPDYFDLASQLSDHILAKYGIMLTVLPDVAAPVGENEILLGDTNRGDPTGKVMEYSVTVDEGKFQINVGGTFSAEKAVAYLCQSVFTGQDITLESGEHYKKMLIYKAYPVTEGASARIMSANVLADAFANSSYKEAHYRAEIFAGMLVSYTPDVVGLQEADAAWDSVLNEYLLKIQKDYGITYSRGMANYEDKLNYTSFIYRSDKLEQADSGIHVFDWWEDPSFDHNYHMRNISWMQFAVKNAPEKQFIVANTHWSYRTEHSGGDRYLTGGSGPIVTDELRQQCREETDSFMQSLKGNHPNMPVFLTGDFNTSLSLFTDSGWSPATYSLISQQAKAENTALNVVPASGHYDHLFGTGAYTILCYAYFKDPDYHDLVTDHPFVYADLAF